MSFFIIIIVSNMAFIFKNFFIGLIILILVAKVDLEFFQTCS